MHYFILPLGYRYYAFARENYSYSINGNAPFNKIKQLFEPYGIEIIKIKNGFKFNSKEDELVAIMLYG